MTPQVHVLPDLFNFSMQIAATVVLFLILRHFLFQPMTDFLNERKEKVAKDLNEAKATKEKAHNLKRDYEMKIEASKNEAKEIIEAGRKRGDEVREEIVGEAKKEAERLKERAHKDITREKEKAQEDLKQEMITVAMLAASKVVEKSLDETAHKDMINKFIDEVGEGQWQN